VFAAAEGGFAGAEVELAEGRGAVAVETLLFEQGGGILLCSECGRE
jgi:hypothetical protein